MASKQTTKKLLTYFQRNGVVREPNLQRRAEEKQAYKKGYEVRLTAFDDAELADIRTLLEAAGFKKPAAAFRKGRRWIQPVYGKPAVEWFRQDLPLPKVKARRHSRTPAVNGAYRSNR
ncbi:MAG: hypothetical protein ACJ8F7_05460 [Gemmataceae bacterium]